MQPTVPAQNHKTKRSVRASFARVVQRGHDRFNIFEETKRSDACPGFKSDTSLPEPSASSKQGEGCDAPDGTKYSIVLLSDMNKQRKIKIY